MTNLNSVFSVSMVRSQFATPRDARRFVNNPQHCDILNVQSTAAIDELKFAMQALFEYGNDQIVYDNTSAVPRERTNLIITDKAPGVF